MVDSIDPSAFNALTALNAINQVSNLVPSNKEVAERSDTNARTDTVRARLSDTSGVRSAREVLGNAEAAAAAAVEASGQIKDVLFEMRSVAIQAKEDNLDKSSRDKLESRFNELAARVDDHVGAAAVNGTNLLARGAPDVKLATARSGRGLTERQRDSEVDRFDKKPRRARFRRDRAGEHHRFHSGRGSEGRRSGAGKSRRPQYRPD